MNIPAQLAAVLLGLLSGALLLIAVSLVPYWQTLDPLEFSQWLGTNKHFIRGFMLPLGVTAAAVTLLATGIAFWKNLPSRYWLIAASVCAVCMFITFPIYFMDANAA